MSSAVSQPRTTGSNATNASAAPTAPNDLREMFLFISAPPAPKCLDHIILQIQQSATVSDNAFTSVANIDVGIFRH
jgi:hypothetical protein